jgi:hypothetical protein
MTRLGNQNSYQHQVDLQRTHNDALRAQQQTATPNMFYSHPQMSAEMTTNCGTSLS